MTKNIYEQLNLPTNATDYEIYQAFSNAMTSNYDDENAKNSIDAFIILSDINLRKKYDASLGLSLGEETPWYHYTYFSNGWNFFNIYGYINCDKRLTELIENKKGKPIRCSVSKDSFFSENELFEMIADYTNKKIEKREYIPYLSSEIDGTELSDEEKFAYFKEIYEKYRTGFIFSHEFASIIASKDYNEMEIDTATNTSAQQLLIARRGVCTHFASLMYEELKGLGLEAYFVRILLPNWYHHIVLYRVDTKWYICDLTNEYLLGEAGYKIKDNNYLNIPLTTFLKNNAYVLDTAIIPQLAGDDLIDINSCTLRKFLEEKLELSSSEAKRK